MECDEHKVKQVRVPWGEERSRFTALFEALILDWLKQASIAGVAEMMGSSWEEVDGVIRRRVERGLERRQEQRKLLGEGAQRLKGSRYLWLKNPQPMDWQRWKEFATLRDSALQTSGSGATRSTPMTPVGLPQSHLGAQGLAGLVSLGHPLSPGTGQACGPHGSEAHGRNPHRGGPAGDQRPGRRNQRGHPVGEVPCPRLPQPSALPGRHLLRWLGWLPTWCCTKAPYPLEFLKVHHGFGFKNQI